MIQLYAEDKENNKENNRIDLQLVEWSWLVRHQNLHSPNIVQNQAYS